MNRIGVLFAAVVSFLALRPPSASAQVLYVADTTGRKIQMFSPDGTYLGVFASTNLLGPNGIDLDSGGNLYAANYGGVNVSKFSPSGTFVGAIAPMSPFNPLMVAVDPTERLFVVRPVTPGNEAVVTYTTAGVFLGTFPTGLTDAGGIAFDTVGNVYIATASGNTVRRFSPAGVDLGVFASGLAHPFGLAFDSTGNLFVVESAAGDVRKFGPSGSDLGVFASGLGGPLDIEFDEHGSIYVSNGGSFGAIAKFSSAGALLGTFNVPGSTGVNGLAYKPSIQAVPEPGSLALFGGITAAGFLTCRRTRKCRA